MRSDIFYTNIVCPYDIYIYIRLKANVATDEGKDRNET